MALFIFTILLVYAIDTFLVGIAFYSLKDRFHWNMSSRMTLLWLFLIFAFLENYMWPFLLTLDISYTVGNPDIAEVLDLKPNEPLVDLFGFGFFEFITWGLQSVFAAIIGEKILTIKTQNAV